MYRRQDNQPSVLEALFRRRFRYHTRARVARMRTTAPTTPPAMGPALLREVDAVDECTVPVSVVDMVSLVVVVDNVVDCERLVAAEEIDAAAEGVYPM